ncbi:MAG: hypothetical protein WCO44_12505 [Bacteroidota bacterium]
MNHTIGRHRRLYGLFHDTGTEKYRHDLVRSFTDGRTENSSELSDLEADELIRHLETLIKKPHGPTLSGVDYQGQQQRRRILSLCYNIGWVICNEASKKHQVDFTRLNSWMLKYGYMHKPLNNYSYQELPRLVTQFENMATSVLMSQTR